MSSHGMCVHATPRRREAHLEVPGAEAEADGPLLGASSECRNLVPHNGQQVVRHQAACDGCLCVPRPASRQLRECMHPTPACSFYQQTREILSVIHLAGMLVPFNAMLAQALCFTGPGADSAVLQGLAGTMTFRRHALDAVSRQQSAAPVEPGLDGGVAAVVGEAAAGEVVSDAGEAVQLAALVQRAAKLAHHDWEPLRAQTVLCTMTDSTV